MVGQRTWQLYDVLQLHGEKVAWLTKPCSTWKENPGFLRFEDFLMRLEVVNDAGERDVKLVEVKHYLLDDFDCSPGFYRLQYG